MVDVGVVIVIMSKSQQLERIVIKFIEKKVASHSSGQVFYTGTLRQVDYTVGGIRARGLL